MKITIGEYLIETDERQFIVKAKGIVGVDEEIKEENRGKEYWKAIAYCTTFAGALKFIPQQVIRSNDDIEVIKEKLDQIDKDIKLIGGSK